MEAKKSLSCSSCTVTNCYRENKCYPEFCLTTRLSAAEIAAVKDIYINDPFVAKVSQTAAWVESANYGRATRVEEIMLFAGRMGITKIGVAACGGLHKEARIFGKILEAKGFEHVCAVCKIGAVDKCETGIPDEHKCIPGSRESMCNPIMQAKIMNKAQTGLNVIVGLCVGHDSLFIKYSDAPVTTLITKDRVLAHNPAGALYASHRYYSRLLQPEEK